MVNAMLNTYEVLTDETKDDVVSISPSHIETAYTNINDENKKSLNYGNTYK
jgi:hypothetical protein